MMILNRSDAPERVLKTLGENGLNQDSLEFISKHTGTEFPHLEAVNAAIKAGKVPITLYVDCPSEANDIVLEARKSNTASISHKTDTPKETPTLQDLVNGIKARI